MRFHNAFVLASRNWKVMIKAIFCQVVILALVVALGMMIFGGLVEEILAAFSTVEWSTFFSEIIEAVTNQEFDTELLSQRLSEMISNIRQSVESIPNIWNRVEVSYIIFIVMLLVYRMLISFSDLAVGFQIHEFMTSNASRPFIWFLVKKFGDSCAFISLQMLLTLPLDFLILLSGGAIFVIGAVFAGWWSIIPASLIVLVLYSLRHTMFAFWLPAIVSDELGVCKSLTKGASTIVYRFGQVFWKTFVLIAGMIIIVAVAVLYVDNAILEVILSTVPNLILFFLLKCVNLVEYFEATNRPYFCKNVDVEGTERFNKKAKRRRNSTAD